MEFSVIGFPQSINGICPDDGIIIAGTEQFQRSINIDLDPLWNQLDCLTGLGWCIPVCGLDDFGQCSFVPAEMMSKSPEQILLLCIELLSRTV